jgi:predicted membrane chloride channel (bestrophin family)
MTDRSIRQIVREIQVECRDTEVHPQRGAEMLTTLTAIQGSIREECRAADLAYDVKYLELFRIHEAANRAKLFANVTSEYARKREAADLLEECKQLIITLRQMLRTAGDEMRMAR